MTRLFLNSICLIMFLQSLIASSCSLAVAGPSEPSVKSSKKAAEEAPKVLVVLVYDQDCHVTCTRVRPMLQKLTKSYGNKVKFAELNTGTMGDSKKMATTLGVSKFFSESTDQAPIVGFFDGKGKKIKALEGFKEESVFKSAIDKVLQTQS